MKQCAIDCIEAAGRTLLQHFGKISSLRQKSDFSNIVCAADLEAEKCIIEQLKHRYPEHNIISEEMGHMHGNSEFTWVIDPLDGTSNFVAGIPWFGVHIGLLQNSTTILAAMYLPTNKTLYLSEKGKGVYRNGERVEVTSETDAHNVLCSFGFDAMQNEQQNIANVMLLQRVASGVRNTRATNSLIDFCYTVDGRFGGCINLNAKIWDIVPISLMLPEAGGKITNLDGTDIVFRLDNSFASDYPILGASVALHSQFLALLQRGGSC
ncbi:MAG: inositol monophosphatase [Opitutaceae bacterium]|jgi:myo-inositol-1(or 4)-monophosphatase